MPNLTKTMIAVVAILLLAGSLAGPAATAGPKPPQPVSTMRTYAIDTWRSFEAMTYRRSGLTADNVSATGARSGYTSPTNIASYLWSVLAARDLGIIKDSEARKRASRTLASVATLEKHEPSGQFFNWYDPRTGERLTTWPPTGDPVYPFLSEVDNGWLSASLSMVARGLPELRSEATSIRNEMDFGFYYNPEVGQMRGGAWTETPPGCSVRDEAKDVWFTCHHYGAFNTEPRIGSYIGIADGDVPRSHYFRMSRTFPDTCDWSWQEMRPQGAYRTYLGQKVFEGTYSYRGKRLVPTWGGSMFEALMVPLLVPEEQWGGRSWGINHSLYVEAQIEHGLLDTNYGYWGFSPSNDPAGGYREYGVDAIGLNPDGYTSDQQRTTADYGFEGCPGREQTNVPAPEDYGDGVVTPHASFLAIDFARASALASLDKLADNFDVYGWGGFYDSVNVGNADVSRFYLALDQGMVMAALANELTGDRLQSYFARGEVARRVRPLMKMERFGSGRL